MIDMKEGNNVKKFNTSGTTSSYVSLENSMRVRRGVRGREEPEVE